jgi:hypothetical protein
MPIPEALVVDVVPRFGINGVQDALPVPTAVEALIHGALVDTSACGPLASG